MIFNINSTRGHTGSLLVHYYAGSHIGVFKTRARARTSACMHTHIRVYHHSLKVRHNISFELKVPLVVDIATTVILV